MLPTVLASSVIRSSFQGESHGGIYRINLETNQGQQILDWNNPAINWEGRGGDRGIRGMAFFGHTLYAVAGQELFAFQEDENRQLHAVASYTNPYLSYTHECWRHKDKLFICSDGTNSILVFDLVKKEWIKGTFQDRHTSPKSYWFDPNTEDYKNPEGGFMHLDTVYADDEYLYYTGAFSPNLWKKRLDSNETVRCPLVHGNTHNARPWRDGFLYNLSAEHKTIWEKDGEVVEEWNTPLYKTEDMVNTHLPNDHARQGYTRGMVTYDDYVIVGTSPATINVFKCGAGSEPLKSIQLSRDIRNAICGMVLDEWS